MRMRILPRLSALLVVALPVMPDVDRASSSAEAISEAALPSCKVLSAPAVAGAVGATVVSSHGTWQICMSVILRDTSGTPVLGPANWRRAASGETRQELERFYPRTLPKGFRLWSGCEPVDSPEGERAVVELREPMRLRDAKWVEIAPAADGSWNWTPVFPFESSAETRVSANPAAPHRR